jgi:hypothetical protein
MSAVGDHDEPPDRQCSAFAAESVAVGKGFALEGAAMNAPVDPQTKALEFVNQASCLVLIATIALLAWVASGVEFSNDGLRFGAMGCLTLSVVFGVGTLTLIPLVQEARRPGQSNFDVAPSFLSFGRRSARLKAALLPQYAFLLAGIILYVIGMIG